MVASEDGGASSYGVRYAINANDSNLDAANFYGCAFIHANDLLFNDAATSVISTLFNDCDSALISNAADFLKCNIVNANTADGVAFITTDDLADLVDCSFTFSDGHAIELTGAAATYTLDNIIFTGYGADATNDAALYVSAGSGTFTINVDHTTTERSPSSTVNIVQGAVLTQVTVIDENQVVLSGARVRLEASDNTGDFPYQESISITRATTTATVTHTNHGMVTGDWVIIKGAVEQDYNGIREITVTTASEYEYQVANSPSQPATGTIIATGAIIHEVTGGTGIVTDSRTWTQPQPVSGIVRLSTITPLYKAFTLVGEISNSNGLSLQAGMQRDD